MCRRRCRQTQIDQNDQIDAATLYWYYLILIDIDWILNTEIGLRQAITELLQDAMGKKPLNFQGARGGWVGCEPLQVKAIKHHIRWVSSKMGPQSNLIAGMAGKTPYFLYLSMNSTISHVWPSLYLIKLATHWNISSISLQTQIRSLINLRWSSLYMIVTPRH